MAKPKPVRVPADDCTVTIGGVEYKPHEKEWVEMYVGMTVGEWHSQDNMRRLKVELEALQGEPDEGERVTQLMAQHFEELCGLLARRVVKWNLTDDAGRPLPQPDGTGGPLKALRAEELYWLLGASVGETPTERKNASAPSPTTSSDTGSPETKDVKRGGGRSRMKASLA